MNISSFSFHFLSRVVRSEIFRADIQGAVHAMKDSNLWMNSNIRHSDVLSLQAFLLRKVHHNMIGWKRMIVDLPAPQNLLLPRAARKLYHLVLKTKPLKPAKMVLVNLIFSFSFHTKTVLAISVIGLIPCPQLTWQPFLAIVVFKSCRIILWIFASFK